MTTRLLWPLLLSLGGCVTWQSPGPFDPAPLRERAGLASTRGVDVRAAIPSSRESRQAFGLQPEDAGIQPLWLEVRNGTGGTLWLQLAGIDPDYFSPREVAWPAHAKFAGSANERVDDHLSALQFANPIPPGQVRSGFVFTNPQRGLKLVSVDLLGNHTLIPLSLLVDVPDDGGKEEGQAPLSGTQSDVVELADLAELRLALEDLPHCAGTTSAPCQSPLNVILVGTIEDIGTALVRRGFRRDYRPADRELRVFGRPPDLVVRHSSQGNASAAWLRVWRTQIRHAGKSVFVAQAARPVGGRFARDRDTAATYPDLDEARNNYIEDSLYSGGLESFGFLPAVETVPGSSDGLRAVLFFATRPLTLADVKFLDWAPIPVRR